MAEASVEVPVAELKALREWWFGSQPNGVVARSATPIGALVARIPKPKPCAEVFEGIYQDRRAAFHCDLHEHDGPHVESGYGWEVRWGEGVGQTRPVDRTGSFRR